VSQRIRHRGPRPKETGPQSIVGAPAPSARDLLPEGFTGLMIATPSMDGKFCHGYLNALEQTNKMLDKIGIDHDHLMLVGDSDVGHARDQIAAIFLGSRFSHMMWIDADIEWPADAVAKLLVASRDHDLVMGLYPKKLEGPAQWPVWFMPSSAEHLNVAATTGCVEIDNGPAGFVMSSKRVFRLLAAAHPELKYADCKPHDKDLYAFYLHVLEDNRRWSEDCSFFLRWRRLGGTIWLDPTIDLKHHGSKVYEASTMSIFKTRELTASCAVNE
jgi:hypothetical protein